MIRYSCDLCKRELDPEDDLRYVVKMEEIYAALAPRDTANEEERLRPLQEIQDVLERLGRRRERRHRRGRVPATAVRSLPGVPQAVPRESAGAQSAAVKAVGFSKN